MVNARGLVPARQPVDAKEQRASLKANGSTKDAFAFGDYEHNSSDDAELYDSSESGCDDPFGIDSCCRRNRRRIVQGCIGVMCCFILSVIFIIWVINLGTTAKNEVLHHSLYDDSVRGLHLSSMCKFKQYCNGPPGLGWLLGVNANGKTRMANLLGLYHHEGLLAELVNPDGSHVYFLEIGFNKHGLHGLIHHEALKDVAPWDYNCEFWCGSFLGTPFEDPARLADELESLKQRSYDGFTYNCILFSEDVWAAAWPANQTCYDEPPLSSPKLFAAGLLR